MKVRVDADRCTGHARCIIYGPDIFILDEIGHNITAVQEVPQHLLEQARRGAEACPESAIALTD